MLSKKLVRCRRSLGSSHTQVLDEADDLAFGILPPSHPLRARCRDQIESQAVDNFLLFAVIGSSLTFTESEIDVNYYIIDASDMCEIDERDE